MNSLINAFCGTLYLHPEPLLVRYMLIKLLNINGNVPPKCMIKARKFKCCSVLPKLAEVMTYISLILMWNNQFYD